MTGKYFDDRKTVHHIAGPIEREHQLQCCSRCGTLLVDQSLHATADLVGPYFPQNSIVEIGPTYRTGTLKVLEPDCKAPTK